MEAATWGFIGTLAGAIVGASASVVTTSLNNWNTFRIQKNSNALERDERARIFQRENLLNLQDALQDLMRLMARAHLADLAAHRETGEWGKNILGVDIDQNILLANQKVSALVERIADHSLRGDIKAMHSKISNVYISESINAAREHYQSLAPIFKNVMEQLGKVLRATY